MKRLLALTLLLPVAGCATTQFARPPADKLVCPDEPAVPPTPVSDEANGDYLKEMRGAWAGCKADVDWLRAWFDKLSD